MSTFPGPIDEIPGISVDRFDQDNFKSSVYFLSHCHSDHTKGLDNHFIKHLEENNKFLYCSEITKTILNAKRDLIHSNNIKELRVHSPVIIDFKDENISTVFVTVTLITAGHCPGSVMFLFENNDKKILYTGDFRINPNDFPKIKCLHDYDGKNFYPKKFNKIYLDTTFLNLKYSKIPTRKESIEEIRRVAKNWLDRDSKNVVFFKLPYIYGPEYVFKEVSMVLDKKVHVQDTVCEVYNRIQEIAPYITNDSNSTPLHGCIRLHDYSREHICIRNIDEKNILNIHISVTKWGGKLDSGKISEWDEKKERLFSVCYSSHASCDELKAFVKYFLADEIYPCVVSKNTDEENIVYKLLAEFTKKYTDTEIATDSGYKFNFPKPVFSARTEFKSEIFNDEENC